MGGSETAFLIDTLSNLILLTFQLPYFVEQDGKRYSVSFQLVW